MGHHERQGHSERRQPSTRFEPHRRPFGDEDFGQEHEDWREPMEFEPRSGRLQWGGESLDRGYYPRRQSHERESERYPREPRSREWWHDDGPHVGKGPKGYRRSDERILEDVNQALTDSGALDATEIEIACKNGEIVLRGSVSDRRAKRLAEELAEAQSGVHDVRNELRVAQGPSAFGQPSFGQSQAYGKRDTER
jgi:hypothetical protein